jgi:hypothetical protein
VGLKKLQECVFLYGSIAIKVRGQKGIDLSHMNYIVKSVDPEFLLI